jgi:branched-chain amino acid transport system ATP-binding protein
MELLRGSKITKRFGGLIAVNEVDFAVEEGEIFGLIGPNGAGKTTLLNIINGLIPMTSGELYFGQHLLNRLKPHDITHLGIGRAFQIVRPFEGLTARQNVMVGGIFGTKPRTDLKSALQEAERVLVFVGLKDKMDRQVTSLTIPDRKRLEVARALSLHPKLLLLDEVMSALTPREVDDMMEMVREINRRGVTIVMIEHVMRATMALCRRILVLHHGRRIALDKPDEISRNDEVLRSYLGERFARNESVRVKAATP